MTKFADQLYADLMREYGPALAGTRPPAASQRHFGSRRALLATGAGGLAAAVTAGALMASSGTAPYALTTNRDGTVTLTVYRASGISQANAKLRQLGDEVVVVPVRPGCPSIASLSGPAVPLAKGQAIREEVNTNSLTVNAKGVPAGDILVVAADPSGIGTGVTSRLTSPPVPSCVSLPS
jgi:hypothetical protein